MTVNAIDALALARAALRFCDALDKKAATVDLVAAADEARMYARRLLSQSASAGLSPAVTGADSSPTPQATQSPVTAGDAVPKGGKHA
jgi:hypothetical protein